MKQTTGETEECAQDSVRMQRNTAEHPRAQAAETLALAGVGLIIEGFEVMQAENVCHNESTTPGNWQRYLLPISYHGSKAH